MAEKQYVSPVRLAIIYRHLGEVEHAFEMIENFLISKDTLLRFINVIRAFDSLHRDPRFDSVLRRLRLAT